MKSSLKKGVGNYNFVEIFLKDTSEVKSCKESKENMDSSCRHDIHKHQTDLSLDHARQTLALVCNLNKSTNVHSSTCSKCDEEINHCYKAFPNGKTFPNPFCSVLGSTLCANCSVKLNRQHAIKDTTRILGMFTEPVTGRNMREQALYSRLNYIDEEQLYEDERSSDDEEMNSYHFLIPGSIARHNTPNVSCLQTSRTNRECNNVMFCQQPLKKTLKRVSSIMGYKHKSKHEHLYEPNRDTPKEMYLYSRSRVSEETSLPDLKFQHNCQKSQKFDLEWPTQSTLNTEELTQKISDVFEQRYLPPANRSISNSSIESSIWGIDLPSIENDQYKNLNSSEQSYKSECDRTEYASEKSNSTRSPVTKVAIQLPRLITKSSH